MKHRLTAKTKQLAFLFLTALLTQGSLSLALADGGSEIGTATHGSIDPALCRYARWDGRHGVTDTEAHKMVRCAEDRWPVAGGFSKLSSLIACESGWKEDARNPYSSAGGLYQFVESTWNGLRSRSRELGRRWELSWSRFNARASAVLGTRLIHQSGYGPWMAGVCA